MALAAAPTLGAAQSYSQFVREANTNTVTIVSGGAGETALAITQDLATVLHCVDGLRIVPIVGRGDRNNVYDLLFLRGVDMAIVQADVLDYLAETEAFIGDLKNRVRYVAPLFDQELHLVAGGDIRSIEDLNGKLVNVGPPGGLALAARRALEAAGVKVIESKFDNRLALERVIDGSIDAMFIMGGKPVPLLAQLTNVADVRLVPLAPLGRAPYATATLTHDDYPRLVPAGSSIETIAAPSVLVAYNWPSDNPRYAKNALFTRAMFKRAPYLRRPARHPKWGDATLVGTIPNWSQFEPAAEIVAAYRARLAAASARPEPVAPVRDGPTDQELVSLFERQLAEFGITPKSDDERNMLFLAFKRRLAAANR